jgi:hypothetical protein
LAPGCPRIEPPPEIFGGERRQPVAAARPSWAPGEPVGGRATPSQEHSSTSQEPRIASPDSHHRHDRGNLSVERAGPGGESRRASGIPPAASGDDRNASGDLLDAASGGPDGVGASFQLIGSAPDHGGSATEGILGSCDGALPPPEVAAAISKRVAREPDRAARTPADCRTHCDPVWRPMKADPRLRDEIKRIADRF